MMATQILSDKLVTDLKRHSTSRGTILAGLPPTPPPEDNISLQWTSTPPQSQIETSSPTEPSPIVAVIGVGYVGTHLVEAFAHHYNVLAFDLSEKRLQDVAEQLKGLPIKFTSCAADISEASHILISVPTVLNQDKTIDTTYLQSAIATVEKYAKPGSTVVVESSVAVGMTRQLVGPLIASKNLKVGMSPEVRFPSSNSSPANPKLTMYRELTPDAHSPPSRIFLKSFLASTSRLSNPFLSSTAASSKASSLSRHRKLLK